MNAAFIFVVGAGPAPTSNCTLINYTTPNPLISFDSDQKTDQIRTNFTLQQPLRHPTALFSVEQCCNLRLILRFVIISTRAHDVIRLRQRIWNDIVVIVVHVVLIHFSSALQTELSYRLYGLAFNTLLF